MKALIGKVHEVSFQKFLPKHSKYPHPAGKMFSGIEHQFVISSIVGDGCLIKPHDGANHRLAWNMGHRGHSLFKVENGAFLNLKMQEKANPGFGSEWYCIKSSCSPVLSMYARKYGDSKGLIHESGLPGELDAAGWAWYYGDDGHYNKSGKNCFLHTEGKTPEYVREIMEALRKFIGSNGVNVHQYVGGSKKRKLECLRVNVDETIEFHKRIEKHMADGMEYKIRRD